jgi:2-C-methyl-D-erythritol 4-phosphate cytidylyltransferase
MNVAIILAGGIGKRFGSKIPKQFMSLNGKPVVQYVVDAIKESKVIDEIVMVGKSKYWNSVKVSGIKVKGGKTRPESVRKGIEVCPSNTKFVLFFDSARPLVNPNQIKRIIKYLNKGYKAVITTQKVRDALGIVEGKILKQSLDRKNYRIIQTPEGYDFNELRNNYKKSTKSGMTIADLVNCKVKYLDINTPNTKITYKRDLFDIEQIIKYRDVKQRTPNVLGKKILILGGFGGIGSEVVKQLKDLGANLTVPSHKELDIKSIENSPFLNHKWDCIINCAGINCKDEDISKKRFNELLETNLWSNLALILYANANNLVLIGSTSASFGRKGIGLYAASKAALNSLVESFSQKAKDKKINIICPANVATKMQDYVHPGVDKKKLMQPKDIAKIIIGYCDVDFTGHIVYIKEGQE